MLYAYPRISIHGWVYLEAVQIDVAIGEIKSMRAILLRIPQFFHSENEPVKARYPTIVIGACGNMSNLWHSLPLSVSDHVNEIRTAASNNGAELA
jgi:hypothetical protein